MRTEDPKEIVMRPSKYSFTTAKSMTPMRKKENKLEPPAGYTTTRHGFTPNCRHTTTHHGFTPYRTRCKTSNITKITKSRKMTKSGRSTSLASTQV